MPSERPREPATRDGGGRPDGELRFAYLLQCYANRRDRMATMKAVVKTKPELGAELLDKPIPKPPEADWLVVKVRATSICGTDVHIYKWDPWSAERIGEKALPQVLGHEVAGEVVEVGPKAESSRQ